MKLSIEFTDLGEEQVRASASVEARDAGIFVTGNSQEDALKLLVPYAVTMFGLSRDARELQLAEPAVERPTRTERLVASSQEGIENVIKEAIQADLDVRIEYVDANDNASTRVVEPLYLYDHRSRQQPFPQRALKALHDDTEKTFFITRMNSAEAI